MNWNSTPQPQWPSEIQSSRKPSGNGAYKGPTQWNFVRSSGSFGQPSEEMLKTSEILMLSCTKISHIFSEWWDPHWVSEEGCNLLAMLIYTWRKTFQVSFQLLCNNIFISIEWKINFLKNFDINVFFNFVYQWTYQKEKSLFCFIGMMLIIFCRQ